MGKKNINFQADLQLSEDFDNTILEYEKVSGISLKKGNCLEIAMKDYIEKLKNQINLLKKENPS